MLSTDQLMTAALEVADSGQFKDLSFLEHLESLVSGLNREAALNAVGTQFHSARLADLLANRLRLEHWVEQYPDILEEKILSPIVVIVKITTGIMMAPMANPYSRPGMPKRGTNTKAMISQIAIAIRS